MSLKKVLVADDEDGIRMLIVDTLSHDAQYHLLVAKDGQEALEAAMEHKPDLVLLDIMMPERDGYDVCRAIKANPATSHVKVIMLTAMAQVADQRRAQEAGADDYFTKPFSPVKLLNKVASLLGAGLPAGT